MYIKQVERQTFLSEFFRAVQILFKVSYRCSNVVSGSQTRAQMLVLFFYISLKQEQTIGFASYEAGRILQDA